MDKNQFRPLLSYLEALPLRDEVDNEYIAKQIGPDGSLCQSPSATAAAFMATGKKHCLAYLRSVVQACPNGGNNLMQIHIIISTCQILINIFFR